MTITYVNKISNSEHWVSSQLDSTINLDWQIQPLYLAMLEWCDSDMTEAGVVEGTGCEAETCCWPTPIPPISWWFLSMWCLRRSRRAKAWPQVLHSNGFIWKIIIPKNYIQAIFIQSKLKEVSKQIVTNGTNLLLCTFVKLSILVFFLNGALTELP